MFTRPHPNHCRLGLVMNICDIICGRTINRKIEVQTGLDINAIAQWKIS
jgi:hypothetical protein